MKRSVLFAGAVGATFLSMGVTRSVGLDGRLMALEEAGRRSRANAPTTAEDPAELSRLELRVAELAAEVEGAESTKHLRSEIAALEAKLSAAEGALKEQHGALQSLEAIASRADRLEEIEAGAETRLNGLVQALDATTSLIHETRDKLGRVESRIENDTSIQWKSMVGPTVQLSGQTTVGSGVLLPSRPSSEDPAVFETLLLTSWHVVRDIRADAIEEDCPVPVILRDSHGEKLNFTASLVDHDIALDAALLVLTTEERIDVGAHLPNRARLRAARVFDPIVAVGCPLGNDPIPTRGHLSDLHHAVGKERFWMISAPTYIGNSGGGLYSQESHELLGIFSKIYTHGAIRPTIIPHMGLVTPLEEFYDWIDASDKARVIETQDGAAIVLKK